MNKEVIKLRLSPSFRYSHFLDPNTLNTKFSDTKNLCSSLNDSHQTSLPHETTDTVIVIVLFI